MLKSVPKRPRSTSSATPTTPLTVRLPDDLLDQLRVIAEAEDRSLNAQIVRMLRRALEQEHVQ